MKKIVALLLAGVMVISAGCGSSDSDSKTAEEVTVDAQASSEFVYDGSGPITDATDAKISLLGMNSWYTNADLTEAGIILETEKRTGVDVDWQLLTPTNYQDSVSPMLAAGQDLADIVQLPDLDENMTYIQSGLFLPLDDLIETSGVNIKKYFEENPDIKASLTAEDGHIYYIPAGVVTDNFQPCLMINVEWLEALGLENQRLLMNSLLFLELSETTTLTAMVKRMRFL